MGLGGRPEVVEEAVAHFHRSDEYIGDRAYRLLAAAAASTSVAPIPPEVAYFDSPIQHFVATGVLFDFGRSKRARA